MRGKYSSRNSTITCGVTQRCVLSPPLFLGSAAMGYASSGHDAPLGGLDLGDGQPALPDFRFADDIVSCEKSYAETASLFRDLVVVLSQVGLIHNASNRVVSTNEAQPPQHLQ